VCSKIGSGATPRGGENVYIEEGTAIIRSQNVYNGSFTTDGLAHLTEEYAEQLKGVTVEPRDVLLNITGDSVARCCQVPDSVLPARVNQHVAIVRPDHNQLVPEFLFYYLISPLMQKYLLSRAGSGGTRNALTKGMIESLEVPCPHLVVQQRIVGLIKKYDDLIENNRQRMLLLEQAARMLYKEWFVHLRFPGREHIRIRNGVPEGWEKVPVSGFCVVRRGASPRPINHFLGGKVPWFKIGDATASESPFVFETQELVTEGGAAKSVFLPAEELILSNSATCGIPNFTGVPGCIHDGWLYFQDLERVDKWFLYCCLYEKQKGLLQGIGEGATQKNLNTNYVGRQLVLLPRSSELLEVFRQNVETIFRQIYSLAKSNKALRQARDLLLPRLMNGEVSV
jgi:type I restriction enzyme S subunit